MELDESLRRELWAGAREMLRKNKFEEVLRGPDRSYWKRRRDGAYALPTAKPNGEPDVERLDKRPERS